VKLNPINIEINAHIVNEQQIHQEITLKLEKETFTFAHLIMDTKEKQIREALIKLGWTPPKE